MKKSLLFISVLLIGATNSFSQNTIPNAGFENWTGASPDEPAGWGTGNAIQIQTNGLVTKATAAGDINSGSSAIILTTVKVTYAPYTWLIAGTAVSGGQINQTSPFVTGGITYTLSPTYLNGFCKYIPQHKGTPIDTVDISNIQVYFFKWNGTSRDTIGQGQLSPTNNTYAAFSVPITFTTTATPDTAQIILASSKWVEATEGSKLFVDDLTFSFQTQSSCQTTLSSAALTDAQSVCKNTAISDITYSVSGISASVTGLPTGVTSAFAAGVITISGTPSIAGTYNYTVTTTGGCSPDPAATATGSITVGAATISLTSAGGTVAQTISPNTAITPITYAIGGTGTGTVITYLPGGPGTSTVTAVTIVSGVQYPAGLPASFSGGVLTISGTPSVTAAGKYTYTVTTTGGSCTQKSGIFSITILSCTTDPNIPTTGTSPTIKPDTGTVWIKTPGQSFDTTFTMYVPVNFDFAPAGIPITVQGILDSVHIDAMAGIPTGLVMTCGTPNCTVYAGTIGCFRVVGNLPMTDNIKYTLNLTVSPYGIITGPSTILTALPSNKIEANINNQALANYYIQVGTPAPPTGIQSFDINQFNVTQNNPNPFGVSTVINFNCPVSSKIDFVVVDVLGRQVYNTNINATAGANTFTYTSDLASGTYFFSISNGIHTITRKMVVAGQ